MEPDEAADALRDLDDGRARGAARALPPATADELAMLLLVRRGAPPARLMTTVLVLVAPERHRRRGRAPTWRAGAERPADVDGVLVVDDDGRLIDDLGLFELLVARPRRRRRRR